jgi:hypothetical protein
VVKRVLLSVLVVGLAWVPSASAVVLVNPDGSAVGGAWQQWVDRAKVPTAPGVVRFRRAECEQPVAGCYWGYRDWDARQREVVVSPGLPPGESKRWLLHELGHDFDAWVMTGAARRRFMAIMGYVPEPWRQEHGENEPPIERFANAFFACAHYGPHRFDLMRYGFAAGSYEPKSARQHRRICALIRRVAGASPARS